MKKLNLLCGILLMFLFQNAISQINSSFDKGFSEGFSSTLRDAGISGEYWAYADSRKCESTNVYVNDPKTQEKLYADGYRCGVKQAASVIPKINKDDSARLSKKNKELNDMDLQLNAYNKALEHQKNQDQEKQNQLEQGQENQNNISYSTNNRQQELYNQQDLQDLRERQMQSQNLYNQEIKNTLSSLSRSLQASAYNTIALEINRRKSIANNFAQNNSNRIDKLMNMYNDIPKENFNKTLNGLYSANLFVQHKYSFVNNQELVTEIPCLIKVVDGKLTELYPYGKKGFELDYPKKYPNKSTFSNGIVKYSDYETLETVTIALIEPYISDNPKKRTINEKGTGFVTVWTSDKDDEGKILHIQELDNKGNIVREISTELLYAKNENELSLMNIKPIPVNTENEINYFGEPTQTPYGVFPLFLKTSKSNQKPLSDNENRLVEIKKYRE